MNGSINFTVDDTPDYILGTFATYYCKSGFSLNGSQAVRICEQDNQDDTIGVWSGNAYQCYRKLNCMSAALIIVCRRGAM